MLTFANNITTRNKRISEALRSCPDETVGPRVAERIKGERSGFLSVMAKRCLEAGADVLEINLQQRYDRPAVMKYAVETIQDVADCRLCLSSNNADTLEAGLQVCKNSAIVNYVSLDEKKLKEIMPLASRYGAELIILVADPASAGSVDDILKSAAVLVGAANESGLSNDRLFIDPGVVHISSDIGQRRTKTILELLPALTEAFDPPVRTTCWINNVSTGIPRRSRTVMNNTFLAMLAGTGLSSAFADVLNAETMRTVRLLKILKDQIIYSDHDVEL